MWKPWWPLLLLSCLNLVLVFASSPLAHGVRGRFYQGPFLGLEATYSDGTPMSYARTKVFYDREKIPFQTGVTDRNGRFLFAPDRPGRYRVIVEDGEGHRLEMELTSQKAAQSPAKNPRNFLILSGQTLLGLILIFIFFKALKRLLHPY